MKKSILVLAVVSLMFCAASYGDEPPVEKTFILHFTTGEAWLPDKSFSEQPHAAEHGRNLRRLRDEGIILIGARYSDKGVLILRGNEADLRAEIEKDPMVQAGAFEYELFELALFFDGCVD